MLRLWKGWVCYYYILWARRVVLFHSIFTPSLLGPVCPSKDHPVSISWFLAHYQGHRLHLFPQNVPSFASGVQEWRPSHHASCQGLRRSVLRCSVVPMATDRSALHSATLGAIRALHVWPMLRGESPGMAGTWLLSTTLNSDESWGEKGRRNISLAWAQEYLL